MWRMTSRRSPSRSAMCAPIVSHALTPGEVPIAVRSSIIVARLPSCGRFQWKRGGGLLDPEHEARVDPGDPRDRRKPLEDEALEVGSAADGDLEDVVEV